MVCSPILTIIISNPLCHSDIKRVKELILNCVSIASRKGNAFLQKIGKCHSKIDIIRETFFVNCYNSSYRLLNENQKSAVMVFCTFSASLGACLLVIWQCIKQYFLRCIKIAPRIFYNIVFTSVGLKESYRGEEVLFTGVLIIESINSCPDYEICLR